MSYHEPGSLEVFLTVAIGNISGSTYNEYVDRLGLKGDERILNFGSGAGKPAIYLARRLLRRGGHVTCLDISRVWIETAQKRLKRHPNVDFCLGDITTLNLPGKCLDALFLHFVLHDIEASERPRIVSELERTLVDRGQVFIREPLRFISQQEIRQLLRRNCLAEVRSTITQVPTQGIAYEGVWQKGRDANSKDYGAP